jgi:hypothetical protein
MRKKRNEVEEDNMHASTQAQTGDQERMCKIGGRALS